jgi:micrococcal nuclease
MKARGWLMAGGLCVATGLAAARPPVQADRVMIEDGDTLLVQVAGVDYRIQLPDIDAPENVVNPKLQRDMARTGLPAGDLLPLGERAADGLRDMLPMFQPYRLVFDPAVKDRYGRTPGDLLDRDGTRLSLRLVEAGYALPSRPDAGREAALTAAADTARAGVEGLWGWRPDVMRAWAAPAAK